MTGGGQWGTMSRMPSYLTSGMGGLEKVVIETLHGLAEVYRLGACVARYAAKGREVLFLSRTSKFELGKAIRGGVPICWPWFGPHPGESKLPQHGFVRGMEWEVAELGEGRVVMELRDSAATRALFPRSFRLRYIVTVGADGLTMALEATNTGPVAFAYGEALHTYFAVPDVREVEVTGLGGHRYRDKVAGGVVRTEVAGGGAGGGAGGVRLSGETDRVYFDTYGPHEIWWGGAARVRVHKSNSGDTVLWNPWEVKAEGLADLAGGQWPGFVCVEAVNTGENSVTVVLGQSHTTVCRVEVLGE